LQKLAKGDAGGDFSFSFLSGRVSLLYSGGGGLKEEATTS